MDTNKYGMFQQVIPVLAPIDIISSTTYSNFVKVNNAKWLQFQVQFGVITGDSCDITVEGCTSNDTTGITEITLPYNYRLSGAVGSDTWGAVTTADSGGFAVSASDDGKMVLIDVDPATIDEGYNYVRLALAAYASMSACLASAVAVVYPRYAQLDIPSST